MSRYSLLLSAFICSALFLADTSNVYAQMTVKEIPLNRTAAWEKHVAKLQNNRSSYIPPLQVNSTAASEDFASTDLPSAGDVPLEWLERIKRASARHGVSEALLEAVLKAESDFNAYAISPKGARGAMQIMPDTAKELGLQNYFDPDENLNAGALYLSNLLREFSQPELALAAYNAGPETVRYYGGLPPYEETRIYVARVLTLFKHYSRKLS